LELCCVASVPLAIAGNFPRPIRDIAFHLACAIDAMGTAVPETAVNKDARVTGRKYEIRLTRKIAPVKPEPQSFAVQKPPYR
jgi:hypothetical protein